MVDIFLPAVVIPKGKRNVRSFVQERRRGAARLATRSAAASPRILVVDDEELVRNLAADVLSESGYDVVSVADGDLALVAIARDSSISVLITDIKMPGTLDGWALARTAKSMRPDLRVIYMTGYAKQLPEGCGPGYGPVLSKPWRLCDLLACVRGAT